MGMSNVMQKKGTVMGWAVKRDDDITNVQHLLKDTFNFNINLGGTAEDKTRDWLNSLAVSNASDDFSRAES